MQHYEELTGLEEHLHDEASECGELAALREEARRDAAREAAYADQEEAEHEAAWLAANPGGFCCYQDRALCGLENELCF